MIYAWGAVSARVFNLSLMLLGRICFETAEDSFAFLREFNDVHFRVVRVSVFR